MSFKFLLSIAILSSIIFIHEFGHYIVSRICAIGVETFSIGFGRPIYSFINKHGTQWQICMLPLGGYIKPKDEEIVEGRKIHGLKFNDSGFVRGTLVAFAGPLFNFITAFFCIFFLAITFGFPKFSPEIKEVLPGSPAYDKLISGDMILEINSSPITNSLTKHANPNILIKRNGNILSVDITKKLEEPYKLVMKTTFEKLPVLKALNLSVSYVVSGIYFSFKNILKAIVNFNIQGPIGIMKTAVNVQKNGIADLIVFIAQVSIGVGFFNLLPIPTLDGGRIILFLICALIRKPLSLKVEKSLSYVSLFFIGLIFFIGFFSDIKEMFI